MRKKIFALLSFVTLLSSLAFGAEKKEEKDEEEHIAAIDNLGPTSGGFSSVGEFGPEDQDFVDPKMLRDFIESRSLIECRQKEGALTIAADVRARWICTGEEVNGKRERGDDTNTAINIFKSEFNLFLDYVAPRGWVSTKVKWVVFDGVDGGSSTKVDLDRAFIGYDVYERGCEDFYIEIGRSKLDYMFESKVEFSTFFDGIHFYYTDTWKDIGVFTLHGGPFIVDSFSNHYAWIVETGVKKWANTGFSIKYSLIDWHRHAPTLNYGNRKDSGDIFIIDNPRYRFIVSQLIFGYEQTLDLPGCKILYAYAAVLANHDAKKTRTTHNRYANKAWYTGFTMGKLCKACDWSVDINYQWVQAQAVPEFDLSGIGHGNAANTLLSDAIILGLTPFNARGFTNFQGLQVSLLYALTDSLTLRSKAEYSVPIDRDIGGSFFYKNFEMAVIYAF